MHLPNRVLENRHGFVWGASGVQERQWLRQPIGQKSSDIAHASGTLVVIDAHVEHDQTLIEDLRGKAIIQRLSPEQDGVEAIAQTLKVLGTIHTIHLVSHGAPGYLRLGKSDLSLDTLSHYRDTLRQWFSPQISHPSLVIYGCRVAAGDAGDEFIRTLHALTQASITASETITGHPKLGGDWHLGYQIGEIAGLSIFSKTLQHIYPGAFPSGVETLITSTQAATPSTITASSTGLVGSNLDANTQYTINFGQGNDVLLQGFEVEGETFQVETTTNLTIRRNPQNEIISTPFFDVTDQVGNTFDVTGAAISTDEEALNGNVINRGIEAVFLNSGRASSNIERLDYVADIPLAVTDNPADTGFLVVERGANDSFGIAAITAVDAAGNPTAYGDLMTITQADFGDTGLRMTPLQLRTEEPAAPEADNLFVANQIVGAVYISLEDLGIATGETFFGYSLFAPDVAPGTNLVNWLDFPTTTDRTAGGSIDPLAGGLVFTSNPSTPTPTPTPVPTPTPSPVPTPVPTPPADPDKDGDGILNPDDLDDDNDGILDTVELAGDPNRDTDGDGIIDSFDLDSDNDGILDVVEAGHDQIDTNGDGRIDGGASAFGANGFANVLETAPESGIANYTVANTDGDGLQDFQDLDTDNDGILDVTEGTVDNGADPDRDGRVGVGAPVVNTDGLANVINPATGGTPYDVTDTDGDRLFDFRDLDTDNDGINDLTERGGDPARLDADTDGDGQLDDGDSDGDGITDQIDNRTGFGPDPSSNPFPQDNRPQTDLPDYRELPLSVVKDQNGGLSGLSDPDTIPLDPTVPNDPINGGSSGDRLVGNVGDDISGVINDVINGGSGDDIIEGGRGSDVLNGGTGNDLIRGGKGQDTINGGAGDDIISGGRQRDILNGNSGDDRILGNAGQDEISGGRGDDVVIGGLGRDRLSGGEGQDRFVYRSVKDFGDTITDFALLKDSIGLRRVGRVDSMDDLVFQQQGDDTLISIRGGRTIVRLEQVMASSLGRGHFEF